jgi:hypothetical protein
MNSINIQTDLKIDDNKIRVTGYQLGNSGDKSIFASKSSISILFEDIASLSSITNKTRIKLIIYGIVLTILGIWILERHIGRSYLQLFFYDYTLVFGIALLVLGLTQAKEFLQIETRGGSKIGVLYKGNVIELIEDIEKLRRAQ